MSPASFGRPDLRRRIALQGPNQRPAIWQTEKLSVSSPLAMLCQSAAPGGASCRRFRMAQFLRRLCLKQMAPAGGRYRSCHDTAIGWRQVICTKTAALRAVGLILVSHRLLGRLAGARRILRGGT